MYEDLQYMLYFSLCLKMYDIEYTQTGTLIPNGINKTLNLVK